MTKKSFEGAGVFYLGRTHDMKKDKTSETPVLYKSKELVTHGVVLGMTGSGKTGLSLALIEEAALDGIPAILIDPKGDLGNLLLTFPDLAPEDFEPWINPSDAETAGQSAPEFAKAQSELWRNGLEEWGQDGERIKRLRDAVDMSIYTPGSDAGLSISLLHSFDPPPAGADEEFVVERAKTTVSALLSLLDLEADPISSREHILISHIIGRKWKAGEGLTLEGLIHEIQAPPFSQVGVMHLEEFFPEKDRNGLAMKVNNLLASPGFQSWTSGEPLDISALLRTPEGKPRISIFAISHLSDAERMFFVSVLLSEILGWTRTQKGTTSLRAIVYLDEIFGFFPPVAEPPSKAPLLTLLKQARAFGVGILLATQNPVDLDYKGLSNTGTWIIGRLQTERDKERVLEGLEGAAASSKSDFDRGDMDKILAGLRKRIFVMRQASEDDAEVFESRWAMSYLRGPLTRPEIEVLMKDHPRPAPVERATSSATPTSKGGPVSAARPTLQIDQFFLPARAADAAGIAYRPMVYGAAEVLFRDAKSGAETTSDVIALAPITTGAVAVDWEGSTSCELAPGDLEQEGEEGASFEEIPSAGAKASSYEKWGKEFARWVYATQKVELFKSPSTKMLSNPGESERDFRARLQDGAHESRDEASEALRRKYATKTAALEERLRRAQAAEQRETTEAKEAKMQTAVSIGATILGAFLGRKKVSVGTIGRATTAARGMGRAAKQSQDIGRAKETVAAVQQGLDNLNAEFESELAQINTPSEEALQTVSIKPKKTDISVKVCALVWTPHINDAPAW